MMPINPPGLGLAPRALALSRSDRLSPLSLRPIARRARRVALAVAFAIVALAPAAAPTVAQQGGFSLEVPERLHGGELVVPLNKSQILRIDVPFKELLVGNSTIADVMALTDQSIYVLGKGIGTTNLTLYGPRRNLLAVVDLVVTYDVEGLKTKLHEIMPNERIEVRGTYGAIALTGTVSNSAHLARAIDLAERYAPGKVSNYLQVDASNQVLLHVKFAEVARSAVKDLGLNTGFRYNDGQSNFTVTTGSADLTAGLFRSTSLIRGAGTLAATRYLNLDMLLDALETKGIIKTLAEPTLIAMSGETANFLAGGEFPYPVPQDGGAITIEFKQFGVGLAFTPTVIKDGQINMIVAPEVSQLDRNTGVTVAGVTIPGLTTRRAKTTVELRDGQTFAIAGLLQSDFQDNISQVPWLGDVPILGNLFRSPSFNRRETELVIIVTPRLAKPAKAGTLAAPTDTFLPPSDAELFILGRLRGSTDGGTTGNYGHIVK